MKKLFILGLIASLGALTSSCQKCSTCTSVSVDPVTQGELLTEEVCGTGRDYNDNITIYDRAGWECTEN